MEAFTLDTSGFVTLPALRRAPNFVSRIRWSDLSPFEQGYTTGVFASAEEAGISIRRGAPSAWMPETQIGVAFSDLAPETLARIMKECGKVTGLAATREAGRYFWQLRNTPPGLRAFPPVAPYLGDGRNGVAGLIYLREA